MKHGLLYTLGIIAAGVGTGYLLSHLFKRNKEKEIGGKLMRVNYRFSKVFDD